MGGKLSLAEVKANFVFDPFGVNKFTQGKEKLIYGLLAVFVVIQIASFLNAGKIIAQSFFYITSSITGCFWKSNDYLVKSTGITLEDVGGNEEATEAIREFISYIKNPKPYIQMGVKMPKGILLYGPPGTGKTLIAQAAASEAKIPVLYASGSAFIEKYVGVGA